MILMEVLVLVPEGAMIGVVFRSAVEPFLMGAAVRFAQVTVELPMLDVIAVIIVGQRRRDGRSEQQHCSRDQSLFRDHGSTSAHSSRVLRRRLEWKCYLPFIIVQKWARPRLLP
jgi:hypothetical protein